MCDMTTTKLIMMVLMANVPLRTMANSCGVRVQYLNANPDMELLTSPNYPHDYDNNKHCKWIITAKMQNHVVQIESVSTDLVNWDNGDCEDYLAIYDGLDNSKPLLKRWCSDEKVVVKSTGKMVLVVFHTDQHLTSRGFALKYYSMEKYSSSCNPNKVVSLETSFNPIFVDLPSYIASEETFLFSSGQEDGSLVIGLELYSAILCDDGNFTIYDGPSEKNPKIISWCYSTNPFEAITTSRPQALVVFTLLRPDISWHVLRLRVLTRSKQMSCSDNNVPTVQVSSQPSFISFPYTTSMQGSAACSLRLWSKGRYQTLRLTLVNSTASNLACGRGGINFYDGYSKHAGANLLAQACDKSVVYSSKHNLFISPGQTFPADQHILMRVVALDYPCNNNTQILNSTSDRIQTLHSLATNDTGYPNDALCRYQLSATRASDVIQVEVTGNMAERDAVSCTGDYLSFYNGKSSTGSEIKQWCGVSTRRMTLTSSGRHLLVVVVSDEHDNKHDGFTLKYYSVPAKGQCRGRTELKVNKTKQQLTSPNYPLYYPMCECGNCVTMEKAEECNCCMESHKIVEKLKKRRPKNKPDVTCVTQLRGFQSVCLDLDVLETAYFQYKEEHGAVQATLEDNAYCEWLLTAPEGEVVVLTIIKSEMEGDCSDMVQVYDGSVKKLENQLGRWCASETPQYLSTGQHLLLIFTADDRWNTGGFEVEYSVNMSVITSHSPVWAIILWILAAIVIIVIMVILAIIFMRHWQREQQKI